MHISGTYPRPPRCSCVTIVTVFAKYEAHDGENKTEIVFGTPKTKNSRRTIPLTRTIADELTRWKQQQAQDKIRAGDKYIDDGFIVTNEFGHYFEQKTFKDYYDRLLKDADIGHFTFHPCATPSPLVH